MIAFDTNLLVYAHRAKTKEHGKAIKALEAAFLSGKGCGIALFTLSEFWSIVTSFALDRPSSPSEATDFISTLFDKSHLALWTPENNFGARLMGMAAELKVKGARIFDLQIALTALEN